MSNRIDKIDDELNNLISSVMTKGCFIVLKKKTTGVYTQHYPQKVSLYKKSSRKLFSKSNDEFLKDIYTDKGKFNCQIDGGIGYNLKFVYKDGKDVYSAERTLTFGNNYDVNGNFGNVILRLE